MNVLCVKSLVFDELHESCASEVVSQSNAVYSLGLLSKVVVFFMNGGVAG